MKKNRKGIGLFQLIDHKKFNNLVKKWSMDKGVTKFSTWELLKEDIIKKIEEMRAEIFNRPPKEYVTDRDLTKYEKRVNFVRIEKNLVALDT